MGQKASHAPGTAVKGLRVTSISKACHSSIFLGGWPHIRSRHRTLLHRRSQPLERRAPRPPGLKGLRAGGRGKRVGLTRRECGYMVAGVRVSDSEWGQAGISRIHTGGSGREGMAPASCGAFFFGSSPGSVVRNGIKLVAFGVSNGLRRPPPSFGFRHGCDAVPAGHL